MVMGGRHDHVHQGRRHDPWRGWERSLGSLPFGTKEPSYPGNEETLSRTLLMATEIVGVPPQGAWPHPKRLVDGPLGSHAYSNIPLCGVPISHTTRLDSY